MSRRVVVLSPGGKFTDDLLALLASRGTAADALLLYLPPVPRAGLRARVLAPVRWLARRVKRRLRGHPSAGAGRVVLTGTLNGRRMARDLRRLEPDVVVLARCGLIAPPLLSVPREGTVNVHPALLPWIRGNSPLGNSLLRGIPLGASAFWIDEGIDTGRIIARRLLLVDGGETQDQLRDALFRLWVEMTADAVAAAISGTIPDGSPQGTRFPICRTLSAPAQLAGVDEAVRRGDAKALFDRWRPLCGADGLALPADVPHAVT